VWLGIQRGTTKEQSCSKAPSVVIRNDEELEKLLNGGFLSNIHSVLLPKKSEMVGSDEAKFIFHLFTCCFDCASIEMERSRGDPNASFYSNMLGDFENKEDVNVREMKVDVVERLMKVSIKERDDLKRYIAYELLMRERVSIRLRPRNTDDLQFDADFADSVELQPELKRLKLRNNNWNFESFKFDEVFTKNASQRRVHDGVAKPVVEGVLNGYNGTVMAYGQTSTGKTYTVGQLGKDDISQRGMMVRAMEDILKNTSSTFYTVEFSYLQLYLEHIQDLLVPENNNIPIVEDSKAG
ncbi:hypothetical protein GIB67_008971, partial [Kingdonia uniflora]